VNLFDTENPYHNLLILLHIDLYASISLTETSQLTGAHNCMYFFQTIFLVI
jgi:hypothetical protein